MRRSLPLVLAVAAACSPPKPPPSIAVAATVDTLVVPAVGVATAVPQSAGRWVLLAPIDNQLFVVDFDAKSVTRVPGITSADVPHPITLIGSGDTIIVGDWGLRRFTAWASGQRLAAWPAPDALHGALPRARDAAGQWYFQLSPDAKIDGSGLLDSSVVVRGDPQLTKFDTLTRLSPPELVQVAGVDGEHWQRRVLGGDDAWGVLPNGTLWVARVFQNQIEWHHPGAKKVLRSPMLPDPVLTVTPMDRELWARHFPEDQRADARLLPNVATKPPFEHVFVTPDHRMWLAKSDTALSPVRHFQVVDSSGVLDVVTVPSRGFALGVDGNYILMGEEFPGGIRLLRYPVPAEAKGQQ
ncbi:MAG TPA: hypothetical protein VGL65_01840 [Gemmatimonadales bacterium]|jgi:hypothetical protein